MPRFQKTALTLGALLIAIVAAGCGGAAATPVPSGISDPHTIVSKSLVNLEAATSFHFTGTLDGTMNASALGALMGGGSIGLEGTLKVDGSTMAGDVDMTKGAAKGTATFPRLFGVSAEMVLVDGNTYVRLSTSNKFSKYNASGPVFAASPSPGANLNFADEIKGVVGRLESGGVSYVLNGRDTVDGRDVYHIVATVPDSLLNQEISSAGGAVASGVGVTLAPVDYWVYVDTLQPASIRVKVGSATLGNMDLRLILTRYGQPVSIQAPAAGDIAG
jgi:LppX_LprAFG lipoprotein